MDTKEDKLIVTFDEGNPLYSDNSEYNWYFLNEIRTQVNDRFAFNGYLFLNDIFDLLSINRIRKGQIEGWVRKEDQINYIFFEIGKVSKENGKEYFTLSFNTDGNILDHFPDSL